MTKRHHLNENYEFVEMTDKEILLEDLNEIYKAIDNGRLVSDDPVERLKWIEYQLCNLIDILKEKL